jgi:tetratricopeptide (TPR) repeat protein/transcriptional regulator with XRE-family HTH domain
MMTGEELGDQTFGRLLREHRLAAGLTQEQLAERSGLGIRTIRDLERGRVSRPHRDSITLLATALGLPATARDELARAGRQLPKHRPQHQRPGRTEAGGLVPRQLPPTVPHFVGRSDALKVLTGLAAGLDTPGRTVLISAIGGTAGIGKTALAVYWAHQIADQFPDGQLYVNLRGFDPGGQPMPSAEAVRGFLDALGVPAAQIPPGLDAQVARYRSMVASRRMLILLDNARDAEQVRPLLPGSPGCLVLVTSRAQLLSLVAAEGAHPLTLDLFTVAEARELLARRLGPEPVSRERAAADELIELCAGLPLALNIVAARAASQPGRSVADLAGQLRDTQNRLDLLDAGDPVTDVRAVFSWSYQHLTAPAARMFRLLGGAHPGPDISVPAAASLAGVPLQQARQALDELLRVRLIAEHPAGRFSFHDLLRSYAAEQARAVDGDTGRTEALHRVLDHYLHTTYRAARLLAPARDPIEMSAPAPGAAPEDLPDNAGALAWFEAEYPVLIAVIATAAESGYDTHAWQLPWSVADYLARRGHWQAYVATEETALAAARRLADPRAQGRVRTELGYAYGMLGRYPEAATHFQRARELYQQLGDRGNEAITYLGLAHVLGWQERYAEARDQASGALEISRAEVHPVALANALNTIGWYSALLGDHADALDYCQQALAILRRIGDRFGQGAVLDSLGYIYRNLGDHPNAVDHYQQALRIFTDLGDRYKQSEALNGLGDTHRAAGDVEAARECWRQALAILTDLGHPDADAIRDKLGEMDE